MTKRGKETWKLRAAAGHQLTPTTPMNRFKPTRTLNRMPPPPSGAHTTEEGQVQGQEQNTIPKEGAESLHLHPPPPTQRGEQRQHPPDTSNRPPPLVGIQGGSGEDLGGFKYVRTRGKKNPQDNI